MCRILRFFAVECSMCCVMYCFNGSDLSSDLLKFLAKPRTAKCRAVSFVAVRTCVPAFNF